MGLDTENSSKNLDYSESSKIEVRFRNMPKPIKTIICSFLSTATLERKVYSDRLDEWRNRLRQKANMLNEELAREQESGNFKDIVGLSSIGDIFYKLLADLTYQEVEEAYTGLRISLQPIMTSTPPNEHITYSLKSEAELIKSGGPLAENAFRIADNKPVLFKEWEIEEIEKHLKES